MNALHSVVDTIRCKDNLSLECFIDYCPLHCREVKKRSNHCFCAEAQGLQCRNTPPQRQGPECRSQTAVPGGSSNTIAPQFSTPKTTSAPPSWKDHWGLSGPAVDSSHARRSVTIRAHWAKIETTPHTPETTRFTMQRTPSTDAA